MRRATKQFALLLVGAYFRLRGVKATVRWLRNPRPRLVATVLRAHGATVGVGVTFKGALFFDNITQDEHSTGNFRNLTIGDNVYIGEAAYFDLADQIEIQSDSMVSARASLVTHLDLNRSPWLRTQLPRRCAKVTVERGASVAVGATMLAGSVVSEESILSAGALLLAGRVTDRRTMWAGVPAARIRALQDSSLAPDRWRLRTPTSVDT